MQEPRFGPSACNRGFNSKPNIQLACDGTLPSGRNDWVSKLCLPPALADHVRGISF